MMATTHLTALHDLRAADAAEFGGKSASLGELLSVGIPVPAGFALPAAAFTDFVAGAGLAPIVAEALTSAGEKVDALQAAARRIGSAIDAADMPASLVSDVGAQYARLAGDDVPVAVRSSALGEDSAEATFAGQQETILWVRGADGVIDAIRACWASLYSAEAISYRRRLQRSDPAMGVTVQRMVDAVVSGVMFTCNPVSGDRSMVAINAGWGLGLAVVGGEVTPDDLLVSKVTGEVVRETIADKHLQYIPAPSGRGTERVAVDEDRRRQPCLDAPAITRLVELARRVETHFAAPQDVEWAIDADGELFVLQSRPVTGLPERPSAPRRGVGDGARDGHVRRAAHGEGLMGLTDDDVREILRIVDESDLEELQIQTEGFSLHVSRRSDPLASPAPPLAAAPTAPAGRTPEPEPGPEPAVEPSDGTVVVPSPMLGTFYRAEAPGAAPFVDVGATVGPDTTVGIIEVMKMMNSVAAGVTGTIVEVCAENGALVEYGEPLLRVRAGGTD